MCSSPTSTLSCSGALICSSPLALAGAEPVAAEVKGLIFFLREHRSAGGGDISWSEVMDLLAAVVDLLPDGRAEAGARGLALPRPPHILCRRCGCSSWRGTGVPRVLPPRRRHHHGQPAPQLARDRQAGRGLGRHRRRHGAGLRRQGAGPHARGRHGRRRRGLRLLRLLCVLPMFHIYSLHAMDRHDLSSVRRAHGKGAPGHRPRQAPSCRARAGGVQFRSGRSMFSTQLKLSRLLNRKCHEQMLQLHVRVRADLVGVGRLRYSLLEVSSPPGGARCLMETSVWKSSPPGGVPARRIAGWRRSRQKEIARPPPGGACRLKELTA